VDPVPYWHKLAVARRSGKTVRVTRVRWRAGARRTGADTKLRRLNLATQFCAGCSPLKNEERDPRAASMKLEYPMTIKIAHQEDSPAARPRVAMAAGYDPV